MRGGSYYYPGGALFVRGEDGGYWIMRATAGSFSNYFNHLSTDFILQRINYRGFGFSVRCVGREYKDTIVLSAPFSFVRGGYYGYGNGTLGARGNGGYYWESVAGAATYSHNFRFGSTTFYPQSGGSKGDGYPLHCVALLVRVFLIRS